MPSELYFSRLLKKYLSKAYSMIGIVLEKDEIFTVTSITMIKQSTKVVLT